MEHNHRRTKKEHEPESSATVSVRSISPFTTKAQTPAHAHMKRRTNRLAQPHKTRPTATPTPTPTSKPTQLTRCVIPSRVPKQPAISIRHNGVCPTQIRYTKTPAPSTAFRDEGGCGGGGDGEG